MRDRISKKVLLEKLTPPPVPFRLGNPASPKSPAHPSLDGRSLEQNGVLLSSSSPPQGGEEPRGQAACSSLHPHPALRPPSPTSGRGTYERAAVLVPIVENPNKLSVLFTERTQSLKHHAGQISFPGGRMEEQDEDLIATALRETKEEIGLPAHQIEIITDLPEVMSRTGFLVTPYVGLITPPLQLQIEKIEVASILYAPLDFLLDPANQRQEIFRVAGQEIPVFVINYKGYRIWGMTAKILVDLAKRLS